jgi:hypothetical protein
LGFEAKYHLPPSAMVASPKVPTAISQMLSRAPRPAIDPHNNCQPMPNARVDSFISGTKKRREERTKMAHGRLLE